MAKIDKCPYCGAARVVRSSGEWQYYCQCDNPEKRPKKPEPTELTKNARMFIPPKRIFENEEKDIEQLELLLHQTCKEIDRLEAENKEIKREALEEIGAWSQKNRHLQAELKAKGEEIGRQAETILRFDNYCRVNNIDIEQALKPSENPELKSNQGPESARQGGGPADSDK